MTKGFQLNDISFADDDAVFDVKDHFRAKLTKENHERITVADGDFRLAKSW